MPKTMISPRWTKKMIRYIRLYIMLVAVYLFIGIGAQAQTTVNLSVTDTPDNQTWNTGTWSVQLIPPPGNPSQTRSFTLLSGGGSLASQNGTLSGTGTASMTLPANANIGPAGTLWQFTVCPQASASCFQQNVTISVSTPQTLNLTPASIRINLPPASSPAPILAYATGEIASASIGSNFWLIGTGQQFCTAVSGSSCTSWASGGGSAFAGGLGASFQDATEIATPANPTAGNDRLSLNSTTHLLTCQTSSGASCMPTGGSPSFSSVTTGTNAAALHVGTGGTLDATGTGTISATALNGTALSGLATGIVKNTTATGVPSIAVAGDFPTLNQNTSGTAANLSGTPALPNGTTATTQAALDNTTKIATDAFVLANALTNPMTTIGDMIGGGTAGAATRIVGGLTGQVPTASNGATPAFASPGVPDGNGGAVVTTTPYVVLCDSATAIRDRVTTIRFQSGASVITAPDHTASGCGSNMVFTLIDDGAGTLTINRSGSDTFSVFNGSTNTDGATSFTLTNGQYATLNNGAGAVWETRVTTGGSGTVTSVDGSAGNGVQTVQGGSIAAITTSGTVQASQTIDSQTGVTSYALPNGSRGKLVVRSNTGTAMTDTIAQAAAGAAAAFGPGWTLEVLNTDATATDTITATTSTFSSTGTVTLAIAPGQWCKITSDGTNYKTLCANGSPSKVSVTPVTANAAVSTDQQLIELALPAGYLNTLRQPFWFNAAGVYSTAAAQTPTLTFKIKLCTVSGCGSGTVVTMTSIVTTAALASVTNNNWNLNILGATATTGATGNLEAHGLLSVDLGATTTTADSIFNDITTAVSANIDLTAALFVDFTVAESTASTTVTITQRLGAVIPQSNPAQAVGGGGGATAWSAITNPAGNLALTMGSNTSTFNYATALANAWTWADNTAATVTVPQSSPPIFIAGTEWTGAGASTVGSIQAQFTPAVGLNAISLGTFTLNTSSTNANNGWTFNNQIYSSGGSFNGFNVGASGSRSAALNPGGLQCSSGTRCIAFLNSGNIDAGGIDADLSRIAPSLLGVGSGAAGDQTGLLVTGNTQRQTGSSYTNATTTPSTFKTWTLPAIAQNYSYSCHGSWQGSVSTATLALSINSSVAPTSAMAHARIFSTLTGTSTDATVTTTASGTVAVLTGAAPAANATNYEFYIEGTIEEPAAGGTFAIQAAAGGVGTLTILRGSFCQLY